MSKKIKYRGEARIALKKGVDGVADAVKVTLGARGRNVALNRGFPHYTKDGVTVAKDVSFEDPMINMGADTIKQAAIQTCDDAGDGTTTSTILAQAMVEEGMRYINKGYNPMELKKGIDMAVKEVVSFIKKSSQPIRFDKNLIKDVATVSSNNDAEIGELIAKAFKAVTQDGVVTVEEAKGFDTELKIVDGMRFDNGYYSPFFINSSKEECVLENPYILISDKKIDRLNSIYPLIEKIIAEKRSLLIICEDMGVEPLSALLLNAKQGAFKSCVVKCPGFGDIRKDWMDDIAIVTGGKYVTDDQADKIAKMPLSELGEANKIIITRRNTTIIGARGDQKIIEAKAKELTNIAEKEPDMFKRKSLKIRKAKLIGGVAILSIGGASEAEVKEKADRIDDAISATKAAFEEGIVPGGGIIYMRATKELKFESYSPSILKGVEIVRKAIQEPFKVILQNAGIKPDKTKLRYASSTIKGWGYDVVQERFLNLQYHGIIDPSKVLRVALVNSASVAGLLLTTECAITDEN